MRPAHHSVSRRRVDRILQAFSNCSLFPAASVKWMCSSQLQARQLYLRPAYRPLERAFRSGLETLFAKDFVSRS
jgi:hypothetical protein